MVAMYCYMSRKRDKLQEGWSRNVVIKRARLFVIVGREKNEEREEGGS